ncbi:hypothetical protein [Ensifer sp. 22564]
MSKLATRRMASTEDTSRFDATLLEIRLVVSKRRYASLALMKTL